ncbi:glycosyltransferase family 4 protein [Insolitispirillum peregrinum]|uniref:Glycosyltransferase involved in cell wall bisynthesis n=1 Tax=Insolitispirillum peregrinum TaxID=80876 RepID=A0A1N7MNI6_9PROT|nr:glycosyltransferase family 1 protein [Insolitispirillum peregrinum]SIS87667.1 Glycosyltransferase involved in cell wall bisynthesis [Insolitispirillum peregrinum]
MRILLVSDAWMPQVNGVVRTLATLRDHLTTRGHAVEMITPDRFRTVPCPTYPEIRLAILPGRSMARMIDAARPCAIHIATEGPLGLAARSYCVRRGIPFTTAFHTKFADYLHARTRMPIRWSYRALRWFHGPAQAVMVATQGIEDELRAHGIGNIRRWTRGVDTALFAPQDKTLYADLPRPVFLYVGRVAVEKNIAAFLTLDLPGSKVVVGDGPQLAELKRRYPAVHFAGARHGQDLARHYASADVFVFPSLTDTFGLVVLEALACGLPVAAYPVAGPQDVVADQDPAAPVAVLDHDLRAAALAALELPPDRCRQFAEHCSWDRSVDQFLDNLAPFPPDSAFGPPQAAA